MFSKKSENGPNDRDVKAFLEEGCEFEGKLSFIFFNILVSSIEAALCAAATVTNFVSQTSGSIPNPSASSIKINENRHLLNKCRAV